jgi:hypothetical protein
MVERRLMYRAGDGYVFQHQLLRDHLANLGSLTVTPSSAATRGSVAAGP